LFLEEEFGPGAMEDGLVGVFEEALMDEVWPGPAAVDPVNNYWMTDNAMEPTASRRTIQRSMSSIGQSATTRAPARGSSSLSRSAAEVFP